MKTRTTPSTVTFGEWLSLYFTGLFLLVFVLAHLWAVHYAADNAAGITFEAVREKLRNPLFTVLDLGLLALALYHGLVGLRRFVVDLEIFDEAVTRIFTWSLVALGLIGLYYGWLIYRAFVG